MGERCGWQQNGYLSINKWTFCSQQTVNYYLNYFDINSTDGIPTRRYFPDKITTDENVALRRMSTWAPVGPVTELRSSRVQFRSAAERSLLKMCQMGSGAHLAGAVECSRLLACPQFCRYASTMDCTVKHFTPNTRHKSSSLHRAFRGVI